MPSMKYALCPKCGRIVHINQLVKNMDGQEILDFHYVDSHRTAECPGSRKAVEAKQCKA